MKKIYFTLLIFSALASGLSAQNFTFMASSPALRDSLFRMYPGVKNVSWSKEGDDEAAHFVKNKNPHTVLFHSGSQWFKTEIEWKIDSLRPGLKAALAKDYPGSEVKTILRIIERGKEPFCKITVQKGTIIQRVRLTDEGKPVVDE